MAEAGDRILVAFDGSPPSLAAASLAFDLADWTGGAVRLLAVVTDDEAGRLIDRFSHVTGRAEERREEDLRSAVDYVVGIGQRRGVAVEPVVRTTGSGGEAFTEILSEAGQWGAAWIFMGRTSSSGPGRALLGSQTEHILEFARVPVVVVPAGGTDPPREPAED